MNDDQLESGLGTALREYADDIHPDLDALARTSRAAGGRIRARRRMGGSLAAAAAVAGIVGVATIGSQLGHPNASTTPDFAGQPTGAAHAHRFHARCSAAGGTRIYLGNHPKDVKRALRSIASLPGGAACAKTILAQQHGLRSLLGTMPGKGHSTVSTNTVYKGQSVTIHLSGWKQVGVVGDDKQSLEGPGGAVADIVWRNASEHDAWVSSADKGNTPAVWTSEVHEGVFVSIQGGSGTSDADVQALGASLTWN